MAPTFLTPALRLLIIAHLSTLVAAEASKALAFSLTGVGGLFSILFLVLIILGLRWRHKRRKARGDEDTEGWCACKDCSGCKKRRGGGDGSAACGVCRETCVD
jgi:membrane protein implicated in regulation of membrane protease activity